MQIRSRLTFQFLLIVAGIMVISLSYIYYEFNSHLQNEFYNNLRSKAIMTCNMIIGKPWGIPAEQGADLSGEKLSYSENIRIYSADLKRIYSLNPVDQDVPLQILKDVAAGRESRFSLNHYSAIGILYTKNTDKYIVIAESVFDPTQLHKLRNILFGVFWIFIAIVALSGWLFAGQALAPINRIMNQVDTILPSDLSRRLDFTEQNDELSRLTRTFNKLLDRIQGAFNNQKLFLSNISHELRNPMNVIITQLEIALSKDRARDEYRKTLSSVLEDVKELNDVSSKLMQLARINSDGRDIIFSWIRLDEVLWQTRDSLLKSHTGYRAGIQIVDLPENEESLMIWGNEMLLKTAIYNLMENACKFNPSKEVDARLSCSEGRIMLEISDRGPGIPEAEIPMVFNPFYRSTQTTYVRGSGIGLSLVDNILKLHKVKVSLHSELGEGTTFYLEFTAYPVKPEDSASEIFIHPVEKKKLLEA